MATIGDRVGAVSHSVGKTVYIFGYGVYEGYFPPEDATGAIAEVCRMAGHPNPKIKLDNGKTVWGCECWWGPEDEVKASLKDYDAVIEIDIEEARKRNALDSPASMLDIPQDSEFVEVIQNIEENIPELDDIKTLFQNVLSNYIGHPIYHAVEGISMELLTTVAFLQEQGTLMVGLTSYSVGTNIEGGNVVEIEVEVGLILPEDRKVVLTMTMKNSTTELS